MKPGNLSVMRKRCQFLRDETCVKSLGDEGFFIACVFVTPPKDKWKGKGTYEKSIFYIRIGDRGSSR